MKPFPVPMLAALLALAACESSSNEATTSGTPSSPSASATASAAAAPLLHGLDELPKIRVVTADKGEVGDVVTLIRALVPTVTTESELRVLVDWRSAGGAPIAVDEAATLAEIRATVIDPKGAPHELVATATKPIAAGGETLPLQAQVLHLDDEGIRIARGRSPLAWKTPPKSWLVDPGEYRVVLAGTLRTGKGDAGAGDKAWMSGELTFVARAASDTFKPVVAIEEAAAEHLRARRGTRAAPHPGKATLEDRAGHRLVRFTLRGGPYDVRFVEVVMKPDGTPVHEREEKVFTCVAEGTAVLTPEGRRPIEALRPGDAVVGFDLERDQRVVTRVVDNLRSWADATVALTPQRHGGEALRVTSRHPIYVVDRGKGAFVDAGRFASGSLMGPAGELHSVRARPAEGGFVYDLAVEWPHTYFAGGALVHNKAAPSIRGRQVQRDTWSDVDLRPDG